MPDVVRVRVGSTKTLTQRDQASTPRPAGLNWLSFSDLVARRDALRDPMKRAKVTEMFR